MQYLLDENIQRLRDLEGSLDHKKCTWPSFEARQYSSSMPAYGNRRKVSANAAILEIVQD